MQTVSALFRVGVTLAIIALPALVLPALWEKAIWFYRLSEYLETNNIHASCRWADYWTDFVELRLVVSGVFVLAVVASVWVRRPGVAEGICSLAIFLSSGAIACFALGFVMAIPCF